MPSSRLRAYQSRAVTRLLPRKHPQLMPLLPLLPLLRKPLLMLPLLLRKPQPMLLLLPLLLHQVLSRSLRALLTLLPPPVVLLLLPAV